MATQTTYKGAPTAKSVLFSFWDDGLDASNDALIHEFGIAISTLRSYRVEWRKRHGRGVKKDRVVAVVDPANLPFETKKGIVWNVWEYQASEKLKCERCPIREQCVREVTILQYGYLGCEAVYECELWGEDQQHFQLLRSKR